MTRAIGIALVIGAVAGGLLGLGGLLVYQWFHQPAPTPVPPVPLALELKYPPALGRQNTINTKAMPGVTKVTIKLVSAPGNAKPGTDKERGDFDFSPEGDHANLVSPIPGDYHIQALAIYQDAPISADLTVTLPGPGPGPGPPPDAFQQALQAAYTTETDTAKAALKTSLAGIYTQAAKDAADASVGTWGVLFTKMQANVAAAGLTGKLPSVKAVIQKELTVALPFAQNQTFTADTRQQGVAEFTKVATALGKIP